ncbi:hypothetical protein U1Q18_015897 [Sarracenia purpurea var. burkii]
MHRMIYSAAKRRRLLLVGVKKIYVQNDVVWALNHHLPSRFLFAQEQNPSWNGADLNSQKQNPSFARTEPPLLRSSSQSPPLFRSSSQSPSLLRSSFQSSRLRSSSPARTEP